MVSVCLSSCLSELNESDQSDISSVCLSVYLNLIECIRSFCLSVSIELNESDRSDILSVCLSICLCLSV